MKWLKVDNDTYSYIDENIEAILVCYGEPCLQPDGQTLKEWQWELSARKGGKDILKRKPIAAKDDEAAKVEAWQILEGIGAKHDLRREKIMQEISKQVDSRKADSLWEKIGERDYTIKAGNVYIQVAKLPNNESWCFRTLFQYEQIHSFISLESQDLEDAKKEALAKAEEAIISHLDGEVGELQYKKELATKDFEELQNGL